MHLRGGGTQGKREQEGLEILSTLVNYSRNRLFSTQSE